MDFFLEFARLVKRRRETDCAVRFDGVGWGVGWIEKRGEIDVSFCAIGLDWVE